MFGKSEGFLQNGFREFQNRDNSRQIAANNRAICSVDYICLEAVFFPIGTQLFCG